MAQNSSLIDDAVGIENKFENFLGNPSKAANQKAQSANWKPEANEEQKEQIERESGRKKLTADGPTLGGKKKAKAKTRKAPARKRE
jgi:hypothetical protein